MSQSSFAGFPAPRPDKKGTNTGDATATAAQILAGQTAYAVGVKVTGAMSNNGQKILTPSTAQQAIVQGYHDGTGYAQGDANLIAANILSGKSIFGVAGSVTQLQFAAGTVTNSTSAPYNVTVSGIAFQPTVIILEAIISGSPNIYYVSVYNSKFNSGNTLDQQGVFDNNGSGTSGMQTAGAWSVNASGFVKAVGLSTAYSWNWYAWGN